MGIFKRSGIQRRKPVDLYSFLLVAVGILINFVFSKLVLLFELPLFLDSIGTVISAVLGGYLPGIFVGFFSNVINSISDPITMYYSIINVFIAVGAAWMSKKGYFNKWHKAILAVLLFSFLGGGVGSILTWLLYGMGIGSGISAPYALYIMKNTNLDAIWSQLIADMVIDIIDKTVTVYSVFFALKVLPKKLLSRFPLGNIYVTAKQHQTYYNKAITRLDKHFKRHRLLRNKIAALIIMTASILTVLAVSIGLTVYMNTMNDRYIETAKSVTELMVRAIAADNVDGYVDKKIKDNEYRETEKEFVALRNAFPSVKYMYVYQIKEDGCHVVFDVDSVDGLEGEELGTVIEFDGAFMPQLDKLLNGEPIDVVIAKGQYGWLLTVYEPVVNSEGKCVAYAAADIAMEEVISDRYVYVIRIASLLFGATIIILSFIIWFSDRNISVPLDALATATGEFAYDSDTGRAKSTETLKNLGINTGDEIETLYKAIVKTSSDFAVYADEIAEKNSEITEQARVITKLQDNMIFSFATLVENRDENTGGHIIRTAAYVRALAVEMAKSDKYREVLTPDSIERFEKSAPLHDIGKVRIPDSILNKPGRLTKEEFEIIKLHTSYGRDILLEIFKDIQGKNRISEAINMAASHHERWDGAGYPDGLRGEDIPLCAAIMAVADVFDALMTKRSYKDAFSFEAAMKILNDESGTHFNPDVVDAANRISDEMLKLSRLK